ncbi:MAG: GNAT family N-acetyltransferase [Rhodospirillaceae bacterium]
MSDADAPADGLIVRGVAVRDVPALHRLCEELGYAPAREGFGDRLMSIVERGGHAVFVAAGADDRPVGFVHVFTRHGVELEPCAQLQALVDSEAARRLGAGALLMAAAEQWALAEGLAWVSLYSTTTRAAAHKFYAAQGYDGTRTSTRFDKKL